jgi:hypothetical protein
MADVIGIVKKCAAALLVLGALSACQTVEKTYGGVKENVLGFKEAPAVVRQPVVPEMLVNCRGHVLVPALGMKMVFRGATPPEKGQYLREERLEPPYRIIRPGARVSMDQNPKRLNVELDEMDRLIGLYCG